MGEPFSILLFLPGPGLMEEVAGSTRVDTGLSADLNPVPVRVGKGPSGVAVVRVLETEPFHYLFRLSQIEVGDGDGEMVDHRPVVPLDEIDGILRIRAEVQGTLDAVLEGYPHAEQIDVEITGPPVVGHAIGDMVDGGCFPTRLAGP